jgi:hypothetical protein
MRTNNSNFITYVFRWEGSKIHSIRFKFEVTQCYELEELKYRSHGLQRVLYQCRLNPAL